MRLARRAALFGVALVLFAGISSPARAISITIDSLTKVGDTANFVSNSSGNSGEWQSKVYTLASGASAADAVGASVQAKTRYASVLGSDSNAANFGSRGDSATSKYQVTFTVTPSSGNTVFDLNIGTLFNGRLVNREEGGASGSQTVSNVSGSLNGVGQGGLGIATAQNQSTNSTAVAAINKAGGGLTLSGLTGPQTYTLEFTWTQQTNSGNNILSGGDEAVVLLGLGSGIDGTSTASGIGAADDYPGTAGVADSTTLGHFVTISATVVQVPEPSTLAMALVAGLGISLFGWRRRRA